MSYRRITYTDGRQEILRVDESTAETVSGPLSQEISILWLEDIAPFPYVRVVVSRSCKNQRGKLQAASAGRVIGFSRLRSDAPPDPATGCFTRRVFYLRDVDLDGTQAASGKLPRGALDPRTIAPGLPGTPAAELPSTKQAPATRLKPAKSVDPLDDAVMEWLGENTANAAASSRRPRPGLIPDTLVSGDTETEIAAGLNALGRGASAGKYGALFRATGGAPILLETEKMTVGRSPECDIHLAHKNVSALHCELELDGGYWFVRDQGSTNGIKVEGKQVPAGTRKLLPPDARLRIAKAIEFVIRYNPEENGAVGMPPAEEAASISAESLLSRAGINWPKHKR